MPNRYAPVLNPRSEHPVVHEIDNEMQAAFDYSDDDDEEIDDTDEAAESRPLNPGHTSPSSPPQDTPAPGVYDFENIAYDHPPPGSPPRPSATALPNEHGNTNGFIPNFDSTPRPIPRQNWLQRSAIQILPSTFSERLGLRNARTPSAVGGGTQNDGVFANVTAKPSIPVRVQEGDETFVIPEDARDEAPPSYAAAQADAVPPYWDTIVHAPFAPDSVGEMIIDSLPTGSLFSFLWNLLVSISFQFVGFLLTYLLHTTHAARFGSRAGLGVTLIQYGFALRSRLDNEGDPATWGTWKTQPTGSISSEVRNIMSNSTLPYGGEGATSGQQNSMFAEATTEWLSFFLMTIGWFILLTSVLGFWRVKRWERGILASQRQSAPTASGTQRDSPQERHPLGFSSIFQHFGRRTHRDDEPTSTLSRAEEGLVHHHDDARETDAMISSSDPGSTGSNRRLAEFVAVERQLRDNLRAAGFM